ncbi:MAG: DMT family transporter [Alkalispirochaeta sp.]
MVVSYLKLTAAPILWGGALVAGRVVAADLPPITITWVRYILVSLFLIPTLRLRTGSFPKPGRRDLLLLLALTVTGVLLFNVFLFSGLRTVTAVRSSVIIALAPSAVALILILFFHQRGSLNTWTGIVVAFIGAVITITEGRPQTVIAGGLSVGDIYLIGAFLAWAVYTIIAGAAMRELSPFTVLTYSSLLGVVLLTPFAARPGVIAELASQNTAAWGAIVYLSIGSAGVAYLFYYEGIRDVGPNGAAIFLNLEPVSAIALGVILLGEALTVPVIIGAILVVTGLYLVNRPEHTRGT